MPHQLSPTVAAALPFTLLLLSSFSQLTISQKIGTVTPENHPRLPTQLCTSSPEAGNTCTTQKTTLVTDALSRNFHLASDPSVSCNPLPISNTTACPDGPEACAQSCVLEGVDYGSIGVSATGTGLTLRQYLFDGKRYKSVSPRVYLLAEDEENYEMLKLLGQELSFDVDVSRLGCGMNGAVYLSEMDAGGSRGGAAGNEAGASYGTGYCDAQCFTDPGWINGQPNLNESGACCNEMDIWEANSQANVFTPHTCSGVGSFLCAGDDCKRTAAGSGVCDKNGCGINTYGLGNPTFYGPGLEVDTSRPFKLVTQFWTDDGTTAGTLTEIRRLYVQDGKVITNTAETTNANLRDIPGGYEGHLSQDYCVARNTSDFLRLGGMPGMGESLARGMVLIFSIWNSPGDFMSWLDGEEGRNGPCNATAGDPANIVATNPDVSVTFSNIRWGDIGSTLDANSEEGSGSGEGVVAGKAVTAESGVESRESFVTGVVIGVAAFVSIIIS
ncbi:putative endo-beta-1,4-glucanase celB [Cladorrhinum sp. PSN332]|nr:putative endo-beta-1,4-glucanase celB [Cladorrhinum sp. PSN332]